MAGLMPLWTKEIVPGASGEPDLAAWKSGGGPDPAVCLHGITAQHRSFNALAEHVGDSFALVGVDLRGRGDSEKPDSGYGLETHARDVVRVLDHLGLEDAVLCGHSMGAFVGIEAALLYPERVRALVLLDGAWPRAEEVSEEDQRAMSEGLSRAFSRLDMTFDSPDAYLDFWFPGQGLTPKDLPPELAGYYLYDLEEVEGGYRPKASRAAAEEDSASVASVAPTAKEMWGVSCPVALVRAEEGFFPGSDPLVADPTRDAMAASLDLRSEVFLEGANHYSMMWGPHIQKWAGLLRDDSWYG